MIDTESENIPDEDTKENIKEREHKANRSRIKNGIDWTTRGYKKIRATRRRRRRREVSEII